MGARPAAGGGRWIEVEPARLRRWLDGFAQRHGEPAESTVAGVLTLTAPDGSVAELHTPPGTPGAEQAGPVVEPVGLAELCRPQTNRIGLLLARQGAAAVGIAEGTSLVVSKVDSSYVQGRTAAGGWSQQRFARRRENQAKAAAESAAQIAVRILMPAQASLAALLTGGDRRTIEVILADPRLALLRTLRAERFLDVAQPRLAELERAARQARVISIRLVEPNEVAG